MCPFGAFCKTLRLPCEQDLGVFCVNDLRNVPLFRNHVAQNSAPCLTERLHLKQEAGKLQTIWPWVSELELISTRHFGLIWQSKMESFDGRLQCNFRPERCETQFTIRRRCRLLCCAPEKLHWGFRLHCFRGFPWFWLTACSSLFQVSELTKSFPMPFSGLFWKRSWHKCWERNRKKWPLSCGSHDTTEALPLWLPVIYSSALIHCKANYETFLLGWFLIAFSLMLSECFPELIWFTRWGAHIEIW